MSKKLALATLALALTVPAFAGTTTALETSMAKGSGVKAPANPPKGQGRYSKGTEAHAFDYKVQAPYDSATQHASGKRAHALPPNGSTSKRPATTLPTKRKVRVIQPPK
jgi:hypothetical protein